MPTPQASPRSRRSARGVVLLYTLIALVIMLIAGVTLVRSFNSTLFNAGNLAFKRDLSNQGERAREAVMAALSTGALASSTAREVSNAAQNYSATVLPSNAQGIPLVLLNKADPALAAADITPDASTTVRYVIDRQCSTTGAAQVLTCQLTVPTLGGPTGSNGLPAEPTNVIYRLSIRVQGPRDTYSFMQATFAL